MASDSDKTLTEAAIWLARMERGLQADEGSLLQEWLQQPIHRNAIVEAAKLWHGPDIVAVLAELVPVGFGQAPPSKLKQRRPRAYLALSVGLAAFIAILPVVVVHRTMPGILDTNYKPPVRTVAGDERVYSTPAGETRSIVLSDGSQLALNGQAQASVLYGPRLRRVNLYRGEAIFQVTPVPQRPFEVNAAGRQFQVSGSRFDVRIVGPRSVELTVLDGTVIVRALPWRWPRTPAEARLLDPGIFADTTVGPLQSALLADDSLDRRTISAADARARLRWQPEPVVYVTP